MLHLTTMLQTIELSVPQTLLVSHSPVLHFLLLAFSGPSFSVYPFVDLLHVFVIDWLVQSGRS